VYPLISLIHYVERNKDYTQKKRVQTINGVTNFIKNKSD